MGVVLIAGFGLECWGFFKALAWALSICCFIRSLLDLVCPTRYWGYYYCGILNKLLCMAVADDEWCDIIVVGCCCYFILFEGDVTWEVRIEGPAVWGYLGCYFYDCWIDLLWAAWVLMKLFECWRSKPLVSVMPLLPWGDERRFWANF